MVQLHLVDVGPSSADPKDKTRIGKLKKVIEAVQLCFKVIRTLVGVRTRKGHVKEKEKGFAHNVFKYGVLPSLSLFFFLNSSFSSLVSLPAGARAVLARGPRCGYSAFTGPYPDPVPFHAHTHPNAGAAA